MAAGEPGKPAPLRATPSDQAGGGLLIRSGGPARQNVSQCWSRRARAPEKQRFYLPGIDWCRVLLAQQLEAPVLISGVLNPWLIGFAVIRVICAVSDYSLHSPAGEPPLSAGTPCEVRAGGGVSPALWGHRSLANGADPPELERGSSLSRGKIFICFKVGVGV